MLAQDRLARLRGGLTALVISALIVTGCGVLSGARGAADAVASAVSDVDGLARVQGHAGAMDFQVTSGLTGERLPGVEVSIAAQGSIRLLYATDLTGSHLPVAVPLAGETTVRRLVMPPLSGLGYNITTAAPALSTHGLEFFGTLTEAQLRDRLRQGGDRAVLLYLYNPVAPLALTAAALDAYATAFPNVLVLRPGVDDLGESLAMVIVALDATAYDTWAHIHVDRYLAGRVGQPAGTDLAGDLAFAWAYPVFDVFPPEATLDLGAGDTVTLQIRWRSQNPDPPPPWSFFVTASDEGMATITPAAFGLGPGQPVQEVAITINRAGLVEGQHTLTVFIQPFSDTFGLIPQAVQREIAFSVSEAQPGPTAGPGVSGLSYTPAAPREGDLLVITAGGFAPGEAVLVDFAGPERTISDRLPTADESGAFEYRIDLATVPAGSYILRLTGLQSGISGETTVAIGEGLADAVVNTSELNVRTAPSYDAPVLEVLARGDELTVVSVNYDDSWIEVITTTGVQGWVVTNLVTLNIDLATVPWNPAYPAPSP